MRRTVILSFIFLLWAWPALAADAAAVAIVWPSEPTPEVTEVLTRLHGELLSVGLRAAKCSRPAGRGLEGADSRDWLHQVASERDASAIIDVVGEPALQALDVWVVKQEPGRFEVTRILVEPSSANPSERIALRAVDALRGSLLENDWAARDQPPRPSPVPEAVTPPETSAPGHRLDLEAGALMLTSLDRVGPAFSPLLRVGWRARPWLVLQIAGAGAGTRPEIASNTGKVRVAQGFLSLGGVLRLRPDRRVWPFVSLAAGALRTTLEGQSSANTQGHSLDQWSLLIEGALGAGVQLSPRVFMTLAAHAQAALPHVVIHIVDEVAGSAGRPNLLVSTTLGIGL